MVERLEEAQECPGVPGRNPWISAKSMDPPRQGAEETWNRYVPPPFQGGNDENARYPRVSSALSGLHPSRRAGTFPDPLYLFSAANGQM